MEEERKFKGIWIPREIWLSEELTLQEKVLLVEIDSLEDEEKGCYASNNYFARFFKLSNRRIAQIIASLKEKGYLNISYQYKGKEIESRTIRIMKPPYPNVVKVISVGGEENFRGVSNIFHGGGEKNCQDNNININNINNNNKYYDIVEQKPLIPYEDIINYLNSKAKTNYKSSTNKTRELIKARINEGFTLDDFKKVIDKKCNEWIGSEMEKYLRPETLFSNKFESYLNQKIDKKITTKDLATKINFMNFLEEDNND